MHSERQRLFDFIAEAGLTTESSPAYVLNSLLSPEEWLAAIRDAKLLVTDSFHGVCFAVLLHVPFVCINGNFEASERHRSLLQQLGLTQRFFAQTSDAVEKYGQLSVENWEAVDKAVALLRKDGRSFLDEALSTIMPAARGKEWKRLEAYLISSRKMYFIVKTLERFWILRKIIGGVRCVKENGCRYTIVHFLHKVKRKMKIS
jgi:hypothetical protein